MRKFVLYLLCTITLGLSGCNKKDPSNITYHREVPAIYHYSDLPIRHMIETRSGTFLAPQLEQLSEPLNEGDLLLTNFEVDLLNQPYADVKTVSNMQIMRIYRTLARQITTDEIPDYNDPITTISAFDFVKKICFFWFLHDAISGQIYEYKMEYEFPEVEEEYPSLCIRAKKINNPNGNYTEVRTCYGFDLDLFMAQYQLRFPESSDVIFYVKYFAGEDCDGCEEGYKLVGDGLKFGIPIDD